MSIKKRYNKGTLWRLENYSKFNTAWGPVKTVSTTNKSYVLYDLDKEIPLNLKHY